MGAVSRHCQARARVCISLGENWSSFSPDMVADGVGSVEDVVMKVLLVVVGGVEDGSVVRACV